MARIFFLLLLCFSAGLAGPAVGAPADGLPTRPTPFRFVTDQAHLLSDADANTLESGLRRYADKTGTQLVVVTVPTLGGRDVADYGRAVGEAWGVGQRDKNNGLVVLLAGQEHKLTIQAGSGLRDRITPELTNRVINQQMTPDFKQGRYFAGLRTGLNTLMLAANPSSDPRPDQTAGLPGAAAAGAATSPTTTDNMDMLNEPATAPTTANPYSSGATAAPEPASSGMGLGMGTILVGVLLVGGVIWLLVRMFRRNKNAPSAAPRTSNTPDFLPNRPSGGSNQSTPNFLPNGNNNPNNSSGGSGMGGILATGAAAAAGAYIGNRMSQGHEATAAPYTAPPANLSSPGAGAAYSGNGSSEFPALSDTGNANESAPDYFGADNSAPDYFSSDDNSSSYDDTSSDDTGGGGFDDSSSNSGSW